MSAGRVLRSAFATLGRQRLRTVFIMASSVLGVGALAFVLSLGAGAKRKMLSTARQLFGDAGIVLMAGGQQLMGGPRADAARLTVDDLAAVAVAIPQIQAWDPQQVIIASVRAGGRTATVRVLGQSERSPQVWSRPAVRGRFFDAGAVRRLDRVAVIGETVARDLFGDRDPLEADILIDSVPFTVIGVLERFGTDLHGMDRDNEIVIPITTMLRRVANTDVVSAGKFVVSDPARAAATAQSIGRVLRERHGLGAGQPDDFSLITPVDVQRIMATARRVISVYLPLGSIVILLVGGVVTATLMLGSVNARVAEIGLRRAVGAQPRDIVWQFVSESAMTMLGGGLIGTVLGVIASQVVASHLHYEGVFSWFAIVAGLGLALATGAVAGVLPARRAARLRPVEALR